MIIVNRTIVLFLSVLLFVLLGCQNKKPKTSSDLNLKSKTYTSKLVNCTSITEIDGYIWIGTSKKGLIRLNTKTKELDYFNPYNSKVQSLSITKLVVDNNKNLWVLGGSNTISLYSDNKFSNIDVEKLNLGPRRIVDINIDNEGNVFLSIVDKEDVLSPEKIVQYIPKDNSIRKVIDSKAIAFDNNNTIWTLACSSWIEGGLEKYSSKNSYRFQDKQTFYLDSFQRNYGRISALQIDKQNNKWIATSSKTYMSATDKTLSGLMMYNDTSYYKFKQQETILTDDGIENMVFDKNENLWILESDFSTNRIVKFDGKSWKSYTAKEMNLPNSNRITTVFASDNGSIWVGSQDGGIAQYKNDKWESYDLGNSEITSNNIYSINSGNENLWIVAQEGLAISSTAKEEVNFKEIETGHRILSKIWARTAFSDSENNIWLGIQGNMFSSYRESGVMKYNGKDWIYHFKYPEINAITEIKDNLVYMGGHNALYRIPLNGTSLDTLDLQIGNRYNINSMASDIQGNIWLSLKTYKTKKNYVYVHDGNSIIKKYEGLNSELKTNEVNYIYIDKDNTKWFATDSGLVSYNQKWKKYNLSNSNIASNKINCITKDSQKNIWIGTDNGISILKKDNFLNFNTKNTNLLSNKVMTIFIDKHNNKWIGTWGGGVTKLSEKNE